VIGQYPAGYRVTVYSIQYVCKYAPDHRAVRKVGAQ